LIFAAAWANRATAFPRLRQPIQGRDRTLRPAGSGAHHPNEEVKLREEVKLSGGFPKTAEELYDYHAVVLDDLESEFLPTTK
jgi:hypothetical protein